MSRKRRRHTHRSSRQNEPRQPQVAQPADERLVDPQWSADTTPMFDPSENPSALPQSPVASIDNAQILESANSEAIQTGAGISAIPNLDFDNDDAPEVPDPGSDVVAADTLAISKSAIDTPSAPADWPSNLQLTDPALDSPAQIADDGIDESVFASQSASEGASPSTSSIAPDAMSQAVAALQTTIPDLLRQIVRNTANPPTAVIGP